MRLFAFAVVLTLLPVSAYADTSSQRGVVDCTLTGTHVTFFLNGTGNADVVKVQTDYVPFEAATKKKWVAEEMEKDGKTFLRLDNHAGAILVVPPEGGDGIAILGKDGESEINCQRLTK